MKSNKQKEMKRAKISKSEMLAVYELGVLETGIK